MPDPGTPIPVVIADDDTHIVYILKVKLEEAGYDVHPTNNGEDALELAQRVRPALVISDFNMPVMDGLQFAIALRDTPETADVPVIMLTARGHAVSDEELARTNIQHMESKPFSARHLIAKAQELLASATTRT